MIKKVGYSLYVHKTNLSELLCKLDENQKTILYKVLERGNQLNISYVIIKYNISNNNVSLIECETWDELNEPIVGDSYCFDGLNLNYKVIKGGTKVYHNKWQFVNENYTGFDIEEAKERTKLWNQIKNIKSYKSKIGNKYFWYNLLLKNGLSI